MKPLCLHWRSLRLPANGEGPEVPGRDFRHLMAPGLVQRASLGQEFIPGQWCGWRGVCVRSERGRGPDLSMGLLARLRGHCSSRESPVGPIAVS